MSYRGTDGKSDLKADTTFATGQWNPQFTDADAQSSFENLYASQRLLEAAQAALQSSQKRYAKGAADVLELLATQGALADAQQERVRCLSDWRSARLRLMSSAGVLGRTALD